MFYRKKNYLDFIPQHASHLRYTVKESGIVVLEWDHVGFYAHAVQKFFHKPKTSFVTMDAYGSFVWQKIDGNASVYDICNLVERHFNEQDHTMRLVKFLKILQNNRFVVMLPPTTTSTTKGE